MLVSCWSAKGGSGTTVVSVALALLLARSSPSGAVLVDLAGDVPAVLGLATGSGPGVLDWLAAGADTPADALARLEVPAAPGLALVPKGGAALPRPVAAAAPGRVAHDGSTGADSDRAGPWSAGDGSTGAESGVPSSAAWGGRHDPEPGRRAERGDLLAGLLAADARPIVADCGTPFSNGADPAALTLAASASVSLLVLRPCFLALRRAAAAPLRPSGAVLVTEPGRALGRRDVEDVLGCPVRAEVAWDPVVARAVDAGLLASRLPRTLARGLRGAA